MSKRREDTAKARGVVFGVGLGCLLWVGIFAGVVGWVSAWKDDTRVRFACTHMLEDVEPIEIEECVAFFIKEI